jgi:hypothetical protein
MFLGGPTKQTLTPLEEALHRAGHGYIRKRIEEDFGFKVGSKGAKRGEDIMSRIDKQAKTGDPEVERQEWVRDVINEDGFADAVGSTEADQVRKNFDTDFPKMEYSNPGGLCACAPYWHPGGQGASAPGVVGPLMPGAPLGPTPMPAMPGIPAYQPMPAPYFI